jgi:hypothetical protein
MSEQLPKTFGFTLTGAWPETSLFIIAQAAADFCQVFHLTQSVQQNWLRQLIISLQSFDYGGLTSYRHMRLNPQGLTTWTVVHEFGHAWDASQFWTLSWRMLWATHSRGPAPVLHQLGRCR